MNWGLITDSWRLKLLAVGLAVLMLGAVAFSQNPPTTKSLTVSLNYTVPPNIIPKGKPLGRRSVSVWFHFHVCDQNVTD